MLFLSTLPLGHATDSSTVSAPAPTCSVRTINYITDSLPQMCLKSSWSAANASSMRTGDAGKQVDGASTIKKEGNAGNDTPGSGIESDKGPDLHSSKLIAEATEALSADATKESEGGALNDALFLSFDDWKKQTIEKNGQENPDIGNKRSKSGGKRKSSESIQHNLDSLGDEGEINLDFGTLNKGAVEGSPFTEGDASVDLPERRQKGQHRNKDAGITCKERYSYASFDAGATVLKTHPGAKNARHVLIENKDSYMVSECSIDNKFLIVELSVRQTLTDFERLLT